MPMYDLIECSNAYLKISRGLWQKYRDETALNINENIADVPDNENKSISFKFRKQIMG